MTGPTWRWCWRVCSADSNEPSGHLEPCGGRGREERVCVRERECVKERVREREEGFSIQEKV